MKQDNVLKFSVNSFEMTASVTFSVTVTVMERLSAYEYKATSTGSRGAGNYSVRGDTLLYSKLTQPCLLMEEISSQYLRVMCCPNLSYFDLLAL